MKVEALVFYMLRPRGSVSSCFIRSTLRCCLCLLCFAPSCVSLLFTSLGFFCSFLVQVDSFLASFCAFFLFLFFFVSFCLIFSVLLQPTSYFILFFSDLTSFPLLHCTSCFGTSCSFFVFDFPL